MWAWMTRAMTTHLESLGNPVAPELLVELEAWS